MMAIYKKYQKLFSQGIFWGDRPNAHFHILPNQGAMALLFNDSEEEKDVTVELCPELTATNDQRIRITPLFGTEGKLVKNGSKVNIVQKLKSYSVLVMKIDNEMLVSRRKPKKIGGLEVSVPSVA
jgi:hypothetical protein